VKLFSILIVHSADRFVETLVKGTFMSKGNSRCSALLPISNVLFELWAKA